MTAPKGYTHATGKGRDSRGSKQVSDVETLPCPGRPGPHWLRNSSARGGLVTACIGCGASWTELDALARTLGYVETTIRADA